MVPDNPLPDGAISILLVEDSPRDAELVEHTLRRSGLAFTSRRVETEAALRDALAAALPDIILADYHLPTFDGLSALHVVREVAPDVPFIFVSGSLGEERAINALREGATDYVTKDRPTRLPAAITRALQERDERRARARVEAALVESERRLRFALQATRDVIWDYDVQNDSAYVSDAMRHEWGIDPAPADRHGWLERIHPHDRDRVLRATDAWLTSTDDRLTIEYRFRRGDGTYGIMVQRGLALRNEAGVAERVVGSMQDVTDSRLLQEQVERGNRVESLGRLAATVAHEFNNVLMSIQPYAEAIRRGGDARTVAIAQKIIGAVGRGRRIVQQIQSVSRISGPDVATFDLNAWMTGVQMELVSIAGAAVTLKVVRGEAPVAVRCDPAQLEQVIVNLVANARDAMPDGGTLTITLQTISGFAELCVSDTGQGIPADVAAHVFEPFFTTKRTGTGLGLSVCHRLITQNGGTINLESTAGSGTTFRLTLPLAPAAAAASTRKNILPRRMRDGLRVLIVEDNASVAEGLTMLLQSEGITSQVVVNGGDAVPAVEAERPDIVVLDMSLPDLTGIEVFDRLKARWPDLRIVFASGHLDPATLGHRAASHNVALLRKPFAFDELLDVFARIA